MKFSEFKYEHLDEEYLKQNYEQALTKLKACDNATDFMKEFKALNAFRGHMSSMITICSIRHTINTVDEYYDAENNYWDNVMPIMQEYETEMSRILLGGSGLPTACKRKSRARMRHVLIPTGWQVSGRGAARPLSGPIALSIARPNSFFSRLACASNAAVLCRRAAFAADSFLTSGQETASTLLASLCRFHLAGRPQTASTLGFATQ